MLPMPDQHERIFNMLGPKYDGRHFADDILTHFLKRKRVSFTEYFIEIYSSGSYRQ